MEIRTVINVLLGRRPIDQAEEPACRHLSRHEFSEGVRFCPSCRTVERFQRLDDAAPGIRAWDWQVIPIAEALPILKEIQTRIQGRDEASTGKKAA